VATFPAKVNLLKRIFSSLRNAEISFKLFVIAVFSESRYFWKTEPIIHWDLRGTGIFFILQWHLFNLRSLVAKFKWTSYCQFPQKDWGLPVNSWVFHRDNSARQIRRVCVNFIHAGRGISKCFFKCIMRSRALNSNKLDRLDRHNAYLNNQSLASQWFY